MPTSRTRRLLKLLAVALTASAMTLIPLYADAQRKSSKRASTSRQTTKPVTSAQLKKQKEAAERQIRETRQQIQANERQVKKSLADLGKVNGDISVIRKDIRKSERQISTLSSRISSLRKEIDSNQKEIDLMREEYLKAIKSMRLNRGNDSPLAFIFASESFSQAMRRVRYMRKYAEWRDKTTSRLQARTDTLEVRRKQLAEATDAEKKILSKRQNDETRLSAEQKKQENLVAELKKNGKALNSILSQKQAEANDLGSKIADVIAQEQRKAAEERAAREKAEKERLALEKAEREKAEREKAEREKAEPVKKERERTLADNNKKDLPKANTDYAEARRRTPRSTTPSSTSNDFASMRGKLPLPVSGSFTVTTPFGRQEMPDMKNVFFDNPGIDARVAPGATAKAVYDGKVSGVYLLSGFNTVVIVNHDNYYTVYGNLKSAQVKAGEEVKAGQAIGPLANDEDGDGMIHFEVWRNREKLNPLDWLRSR